MTIKPELRKELNIDTKEGAKEFWQDAIDYLRQVIHPSVTRLVNGEQISFRNDVYRLVMLRPNPEAAGRQITSSARKPSNEEIERLIRFFPDVPDAVLKMRRDPEREQLDRLLEENERLKTLNSQLAKTLEILAGRVQQLERKN